MAEAVVSIVVGRLTDLLTEEAQLLHEVRDEIQQVVTGLMQMKTFLRDADLRIDEERVRILLAQVRDLVYDAEDVVETFLLKSLSSERRGTQGGFKNLVERPVCVLHDYAYHYVFHKDIKCVQRRMQNLMNDFRDRGLISTLGQGQESSSSSSYEARPGKLKRFYSYSVVEPDLFVAFQEDVESLVGHLVNESDDCHPVIFIGGMGGLGKTTLASKIYNHSTIKKHFSGLAWVSISQKWQSKAVLQRILISLVHEKKKEILGLEVDKLVEKLLEIQQNKNCLIVLDDIWSNDAWDSLKAAFPKNNSRSKLMLTSRNIDVADHVNPNCFIHKPQVLDAEQSWELLRLKALPKGNYLDTKDFKKMEEMGREMVRYCAGLPLAIVVLGGILVTKPTFIEWEKVYNDSQYSLKRGKGLGENQQREVFDILVWSYNVLPTQLKLCFLYMGKFAEDEEINTETLYQLWIAEGMVLSGDKREGETMMQVAESYMGELVHKSMVQVKYEDGMNSQRKFRSCQLHDLMRDLSLSLAEREDFFKVLNLRKVDDFQFDPSLGGTSSSTRQLVVYSDAEGHKSIKYHPFLVNKHNQGRVRSAFEFPSRAFADHSFPPILGSHVTNFRLLRVFALEGVKLSIRSVSGCLSCINLGKLLGRLVHLRYLSLGGTNLLMFPAIQKLELLQTLKLDAFLNLYLPPCLSRNILSKLEHLRHLYLSDFCSFGKNIKLRFDRLSKLETLETFDPHWCEVKDLPKLISLQKLKLTVAGHSCDVEQIIKYLSSYSCLRYLTLQISMRDPGPENDVVMWRQLFWNHKYNLQGLLIDDKLPELVHIFGQQQQQLLDNIPVIDVSSIRITRLCLQDSCLLQDPMPVLEKIPMLRHLILNKAYDGKEMVCSAMGFAKLTYLFMGRFRNLEKWEVEEGSMPILQELKIDDFPKLEELPKGLIFLRSLRKVMIWGLPSDRVRIINGEQGPDFYKVAHVPNLILNEGPKHATFVGI